MTTPEYITKQRAGEILGLSPRRVLEMASEGRIGKLEIRSPETNLMQTVLAAVDVFRVKQERETPRSLAVPQPAASLAPATSALVPQSAAPPQFRPHEWLSVAEAAQYTRLPESEIERAVGKEELRARNVGVRPGGRYRIKCSDLDGL